MELETTSAPKCCDCSYCDPINSSYPNTWSRSVKRKLDKFEHDTPNSNFIIPGLVIPSVAHIPIQTECNTLREMVTNQQHTIQNLISDLEQERYASSSSANEAMSMILKLQREKAEVQMEARQFKRFIEEKMAHDHKELMELEELLYRREQSIQSLMFEVNAYKHRMISFGLMESENSIAMNLEKRFDFAAYDYPPLKCDDFNENNMATNLESQSQPYFVEKYPFGETPCSLKDIEERINLLEQSPGQSQSQQLYVEKYPFGETPRSLKDIEERFLEKSQSQQVLEEKYAFGETPRSLKDKEERINLLEKSQSESQSQQVLEKGIYSPMKKHSRGVSSEFGDEMSDRIYTIDSIEQKGNIGIYDDFMSKELCLNNGTEDMEVKKLYARLNALEADRESMREALIAMRTDNAQLVLLKEIAQQLCKEVVPPSDGHVKKQDNGVGSSFFSVFKWIASFGFLRGKAQRNKHIFIALASSAGLLLLLDRRSHIGRCLSSTSLKK